MMSSEVKSMLASKEATLKGVKKASVSDAKGPEISKKVVKEIESKHGEEEDNLSKLNEELRAEIQRLSTQVVQLSAEKDAFEVHAKRLGETLKTVRKSAASHHIPDDDLGVDLHRSFSLHIEKNKEGKGTVSGEEHPRLTALKLMAAESGWLISPDELKRDKKIGEGATANIYCGTWHGLDVAIKCLKPSYMENDEEALESFVQEVQLLVRQRHPFVLRLFGASLEYPKRCWIVTELLPNGTLTEWLHGDKTRQWTRKSNLPPLSERIRMALEVSLAMQYLHEQTPAVIHRDLKPSNVFVDSSNHVRVADFGFARFLRKEDTVMTGETGTYMYMAPEVVKHEHYDERCDVYSFGILLCELVTGNPPYIETYLTPMQMAVGVADGSLRPKLPHGVDSTLLSIITTSWAQDVSKRPSFAEISVLLKSFHQSLTKPDNSSTPVAKEHRGGFFGFMQSTH